MKLGSVDGLVMSEISSAISVKFLCIIFSWWNKYMYGIFVSLTGDCVCQDCLIPSQPRWSRWPLIVLRVVFPWLLGTTCSLFKGSWSVVCTWKFWQDFALQLKRVRSPCLHYSQKKFVLCVMRLRRCCCLSRTGYVGKNYVFFANSYMCFF